MAIMAALQSSSGNVLLAGTVEASVVLQQVFRLPNDRVYIVVLSNFDWARSSDISRELNLLLFDTKQ